MNSLPTQIVVLLNALGAAPDEAVEALLPPRRRELRFLRLRDCLDQAVVSSLDDGRPLSFRALANGTEQLAARARKASSECHQPVEWYVHGYAPLPLFSLLGFELSAWARPLTFLNQRKDETWDVLPLATEENPSTATTVFSAPELPSESEATGRVALFLSVLGKPAPREAIRNYLVRRGEPMADIVTLRTPEPTVLSCTNMFLAAQEIAETVSGLAGHFPHAIGRGLAVFVAGPASLAFVAGRAINRNIIGETWFPNFSGGEYQDAVSAPLHTASLRAIDQSTEATARRRHVWELLRTEFDQLRATLTEEHLPQVPLVPSPTALLDGVRQHQLADSPSSDAFRLNILERRLHLGENLLDALRFLEDSDAVGVFRQLVIHEFFHYFQDLTYANYRNIGRAGVALEEVDYWADAYAVETLARLRAANKGDAGAPHEHVQAEIKLALAGIETFDRADQGDALTLLPERRLRRYLIWYLQLARSATLHRPRDVSELLHHRLVAELAPISGYLDHRFDKIVEEPTQDTEFVVVSRGRVLRFPRTADLDPAALPTHVRAFRKEALLKFMGKVVLQQRDVLAPWATL